MANRTSKLKLAAKVAAGAADLLSKESLRSVEARRLRIRLQLLDADAAALAAEAERLMIDLYQFAEKIRATVRKSSPEEHVDIVWNFIETSGVKWFTTDAIVDSLRSRVRRPGAVEEALRVLAASGAIERMPRKPRESLLNARWRVTLDKEAA